MASKTFPTPNNSNAQHIVTLFPLTHNRNFSIYFFVKEMSYHFMNINFRSYGEFF